MIVLDLLLFYLVSFAVLSYVGFGPARLLLLPHNRKLQPLIAPLLGYCITVILASFFNSTVFNMHQGTYLILAVATALNILALFKAGLPRLSTVRSQSWWPLGLAFAVYGLGVLPLIHAGSLAFLGQQWDLELYLPITEYLKRYVIGAALTAPDNPLLPGINSAPFRGGSGWGFSYFEAMIGTLLGWMSFETFRPALGFTISLSVLAVYVFARQTLRLAPSVCAIAAGLWGTNGLNLWIASSGLAGHAVSFFTIPFALTLSIAALQDRRLSGVVLAGLAVAGMLLSYYTGAAPVYGVGMLAYLATRFMRKPRFAKEILVTCLGIGVMAAVFGVVGHARFWQVVPLYATQGFSYGWGSPRFVPLSEALGLIPDDFVVAITLPGALLGGSTTVILDIVAFAVTLGLIVAYVLSPLSRGWQRSTFISLSLGFGGLVLFLRFIAPYPYGYFKVLSLTGFLFPLAFAQLATSLWQSPSAFFRRFTFLFSPRIFAPLQGLARTLPSFSAPVGMTRGVAVGVSVLFLSLLSLNTLLSVRFFWSANQTEIRTRVWELRGLRQALQPGQPVYVLENLRFTPQESAMVAYFLIDNPLVGVMQTAYGALVRDPTKNSYQYLLVPTKSASHLAPVGNADPIWSNELVSLYKVSENQPMAAAGQQQPRSDGRAKETDR